jgi:hypothetical protein
MAYPPKPALPISNQHCLNAGRRGQRIYRLQLLKRAIPSALLERLIIRQAICSVGNRRTTI